MFHLRFVTLVTLAGVLAAAPGHAGLLPRLGLEASGNFAKVSRTDEPSGDDIFNPGFGAGGSAAATAEWPLSSRFAVASGLRYSSTTESERWAMTVNGGSFNGKLRETWHWLAVPLHARITPWAVPLSFDIGPEIAVLLQARSKNEVESYPSSLRSRGDIHPAANANIFEDVGTFNQEDVTDRYHRVDYSFSGGMRYAWPIGSGRLVAHTRYGFGLNDIMKSDNAERRTQSVEVGAGWQW